MKVATQKTKENHNKDDLHKFHRGRIDEKPVNANPGQKLNRVTIFPQLMFCVV